ncbi:MAG: hypothetical protein U0894_08440 [Pirellulales bacterium]
MWAVTLEKWPILTGNAEFRELVDTIKHYQELLNQLDAEFQRDFPLNKFLSGRADAHGSAQGSGALSGQHPKYQ